MIIPIDELPTGLQVVARALPPAPFRRPPRLVDGGGSARQAWIVLAGWAWPAPVVTIVPLE
jgi:hypothetical protein